MAKFKAARGKKKKKSNLGAIPCFLLIISGILLVTMLFYAMLQSGS